MAGFCRAGAHCIDAAGAIDEKGKGRAGGLAPASGRAL